MEEAEVFRLVRLGHFEEALPKLRKEPSLWQTREEGGHSVLHWAALQNQCSFVREALQHVETLRRSPHSEKMAESSSPSVWERFFTTSRPKGDWTGPDYGSNPCGLPRRSRPSDAEQLRGAEMGMGMGIGTERGEAGYGERSPPCSARGEPIEAGDLPRRRLSDLATAMQSGSGVREALSPPAPVRRLFSRGAPTRRSRTADPVLFDTVLSGYGERSVAPRRQLQVHDEGVQIRDQGRASGGIPWRRLPIYDHNGSLVKTGVAGSSFETENPLRSVTPYSLISPEKPSDRSSALTPATPSPAARESTPSAGGRLTGRAMQVALVRAQRCNDQQLETERSRCLAKFERLCTPTRRPRRRVAAQHTQPFATDDTTPPAAPARRVVPPQALPSALFLSDGPEPLRFSERHLAARRTWQLEMEMAKIAFTAGRVAASMMSTSDAATPRARSTGALTPTVTPGKAHTLPTRTASRPARATGQAEPAASSIMIQPPTIVVTPVEEPTVSTIAPKTPPRVLEEKTSPQYTPPAAAPAPPAEQVIEMIDHVMSKELPVFSKVLPEPDLVERAPKAAPEPEPELSASPSAAPYPRLLSSAKERSTSTPTKQTQAKPVRQAKQGLAKGRDLLEGRRALGSSNLQTPLMWAMTRGHLQVGKVLLQASADPFAQDSVGASPLILAVQHAHVGAMLLLIALVAPNEPGATHGPSTLQRLLQVRDMRGCTAVHWAAYKGDMPALQLLDYFDADFTALDDEKMTALHRAAQGQQEEVIGLLLDRGVDPSVLDVHGRSCLDVAEQVAKTGRMARRLRRLLESKPSKDFEMGKILHFAKRAKRMAPAIFWLCCVSIACFEPLDARMRRRYLTELQSSAWTLTPNLAVAFELGVPLCLLLFLLAAQKDPGKVPARVKGNSAVEDRRFSSRRSMFFPWCCKPWSAEKAHVDQNTEYVRALPLSSSSSTSFPKAYNFAQDEPPDDLQQAAPSRTLEPVRCMGPTFTPENQEKVRLQMAVRSFVKDGRDAETRAPGGRRRGARGEARRSSRFGERAGQDSPPAEGLFKAGGAEAELVGFGGGI
eukprot:g14000.t1